MSQLDYLQLLARLGPAPTVAEVGAFLGLSNGYVHELILRGKLCPHEITYPADYSAKDPRRKKRIVLNTLFEFLQTSPEADRARAIAAAIGSLSGDKEEPTP